MNHPSHGNAIPRAEWIAAAIGFVLVAATVLFLAYQAVAGGSGPPSIAIRVAHQQPDRDGYVVVFDVLNSGGTTAADLEIEGSLTSGDATEVNGLTLPYVPPGSERRAGLFFRGDPSRGRLELRAKGYREP
jgi:uncharacterized protein (TIGR02588 family)